MFCGCNAKDHFSVAGQYYHYGVIIEDFYVEDQECPNNSLKQFRVWWNEQLGSY